MNGGTDGAANVRVIVDVGWAKMGTINGGVDIAGGGAGGGTSGGAAGGCWASGGGCGVVSIDGVGVGVGVSCGVAC